MSEESSTTDRLASRRNLVVTGAIMTSPRALVRWGFQFTLTFLITGSAQAGGLFLQEYATSSMGTASAGSTAYASDGGTIIHNPAGMTRLEGHAVFAGFAPGGSTIKFDTSDGNTTTGGDGGDQGGFIPLLGGGYSHKLHDRVRLGMGIFAVSGAALDADNDWAGRSQVTELSLFTIAATPGVALKVTDWLSIGGNWMIVYATLDWKLRTPVSFALAPDAKLRFKDADDTAYAGMASVLLEPMEGLRFGVVYTSEVDLKLRGGSRGPVGLNPQFNLELPLAQAVRFSVYWDMTDKFALLLSADWEDWSTLGTTGVEIGAVSQNVTLGFEDTWRVGGGLHYQVTPDWMLQTGYSYDSSALKNKNRTAALPVDEQHRFAFGAIHQLSESLRVGMNFEWVNLGSGKIRGAAIRGSYKRNDIFFVGFNVNWGVESWKDTLGLNKS
jgi:long-chain fatty acid transport protein